MVIEDRSVIDAASWRLASDLVGRNPESVTVVHTESGGGQCDCLTVCAVDAGRGRIDLNRNGSIHVLERFDGEPGAADPIGCDEYVSADPLAFVERLERTAGLVLPAGEPANTQEYLTVSLLAALAATAFKSVASIDIRPGFRDSAGRGSDANADLERFPSRPDVDHPPAAEDEVAPALRRYWVVRRQGEPVLVVDASTARAWTRAAEDPVDPHQRFADAGGDEVIVALGLLVAAVSTTEEGRAVSSAADPIDWNDPRLAVASDPPLRRRYRALQNHHRHHVLGVPNGSGGKGRPVGSVLADEAVAADPSLNFLGDSTIVDYVNERVPQVLRGGGSLDEHRLRHNMLSSMPMAFALAAKLRAALDAEVILRAAFGIDVAQVVSVDAEWAPLPAGRYLSDRSAFDVVVRYRTSSDELAVLGIETKYTEPLSIKEYTKDRYDEVTAASRWFNADAAEQLVDRSTNQLWRNAMLAASMVIEGDVDVAHLGIVGLAVDTGLWTSVDALQRHMVHPEQVRPCPWEELVSAFAGTSLETFGEQFRQRYLNTSVIDA